MPHRIYALSLLIVCLSLLVSPASAQDATEEALSGDVFRFWASQSLFPGAIRLTVTTSLEFIDVAELSVTLSQPGVFSETIDLDPGQALDDSDIYSQFGYVWQVPVDNPPVVFRDVNYTWRVVDADGNVFGVSDRIFFADPRADWQIHEDADGAFTLITPADGSSPARILRDVTPFIELVGADLEPPYRIALTDDLDLFDCPVNADGDITPLVTRKEEEFFCDPAVQARVYERGDLIILETRGSGLVSAVEAMIPFLVDEAFRERWADADVPRWFRSGFTQFWMPATKADLLPPVLTAARSRTLFTLGRMEASPPSNSVDAALWEAQSYGMVLYMAERIGVNGLLEFGRALGEAESFDIAYEQVLSEPASALIRNWQRWLLTDAAESAYGYVPYGLDTPTPTHTATSTFTPIPTVRRSATPTPTITPRPSVTPTATNTPSVTPRPPGSLAYKTPVLTPTPSNTPEPVETIEVTPQLQTGMIAVLLLLLAGLVYVYVQLGKRS
jgi:hypothetical protein